MREGTDHLTGVDGPGSTLLVTLLVGFQCSISLAGLVAKAALERSNSNSTLLVSLVVSLQAAFLCELVSAQLTRVRLLSGVHHRVRRQVLHCFEFLVASVTWQNLLAVVHFDVVPQLVVGLGISGANTAFFTSLDDQRALMSGQVPFKTV